MKFFITFIFVLGSLFFLSTMTHADTFTVDSTDDEVDADPGDGYCRTSMIPKLDGSYECTLRAAVMETNAWSGDDTIILPTGNYTLTISGDDAEAEMGDLDITDAVSIEGDSTSWSDVVIDGGALDRVFQVWSASTSVSFSNLTIQNGSTASHGGGIYASVDGSGELNLTNVLIQNNTSIMLGGGISITNGDGTYTLTVDSSEISNNSIIGGSSYSGHGGGIYVANSTIPVVIQNSTISNNYVYSMYGSHGGGISGDTITITDSNISDNTMETTSGASGGGVYGDSITISSSVISGNLITAVDDSYGGGVYGGEELTITDSTISNNMINSQDVGYGGGVALIGNDTLTISNSTISGNSLILGVSGSGGGLYGGRNVTITNSTFSGNSVQAVTRASAGGIFTNYDTVDIINSTIADNKITAFASFGSGLSIDGGKLSNVILADNKANGTESKDCEGTIDTLTSSIIEHLTSRCTVSSGTPIESDPRLKTLDDNGGPTYTQAITRLSPAYNQGDATVCSAFSYDQRGSGYSRTVGTSCDMGAYEVQSTFSTFPKEGGFEFPGGGPGTGFPWGDLPKH